MEIHAVLNVQNLKSIDEFLAGQERSRARSQDSWVLTRVSLLTLPQPLLEITSGEQWVSLVSSSRSLDQESKLGCSTCLKYSKEVCGELESGPNLVTHFPRERTERENDSFALEGPADAP